MRWLIAFNRHNGRSVSATSIGWGRGISAALRSVQLSALSHTFLSATSCAIERIRQRRGVPHPRSVQPSGRVGCPSLLRARSVSEWWCDGVGFGQVRSAAVAVVLVGSRITLPPPLNFWVRPPAHGQCHGFCSESDAAIAPQGLADGGGTADLLDADRSPIDLCASTDAVVRGPSAGVGWIDICPSSGISPGRACGWRWPAAASTNASRDFQEPGALGRRLAGVPLQAGRSAGATEQRIHQCRRLLRRSLPRRTGHRWRAGGLAPAMLSPEWRLGGVGGPVGTERRSICPGFSGESSLGRISAAGGIRSGGAARRILSRVAGKCSTSSSERVSRTSGPLRGCRQMVTQLATSYGISDPGASGWPHLD